MKLFLLSFVLIALSFAGIAIKIILKKNGKFSGTCASQSPFLNNQKFNNVFLWGEKGMGKSTLVRSVINFVKKKNKKKIIILEILSNDLIFLPEIIYKISNLKKKFIIFIDDINLSPEKPELSIFKVMIEGSILSKNKNIAFYVTSNLRNLITSASTKDLNDIEIKDKNASLFSLVEKFLKLLEYQSFYNYNLGYQYHIHVLELYFFLGNFLDL